MFGKLLGLTGWREGLNHEAKYIPRTTIRKTSTMKRLVLSSKSVRLAINKDRAQKQRASVLYDQIASTLEDDPPRSFAFGLRKVWRRLFQNIRIHEQGLERVRSLASSRDSLDKPIPIVLLPTHRSYTDFLLLSYVFFAYNLPLPYIAASEDFLKVGPLAGVLRQSGAFFLKRDGALNKDALYKSIFQEYLVRLLEDGQMVEFFVEGTRSRTGKSMEPKSGLLQMCIDPLLSGRLQDVHVVPISIDYECPLEVGMFAAEMLGQEKLPETFFNLLTGSFKALGSSTHFGNVSVEFAKPFSLRSALMLSGARSTGSTLSLPREVTLFGVSQSVGYRVIKQLEMSAVSMCTHLVASLVLMFRQGVTLPQLMHSMEWLRLEVLSRGGKLTGMVCVCRGGERRVLLLCIWPLL